MYTHLSERKVYEDIYDRITVDSGRRNQKMFEEMYDGFFKIMPDEPKNSHRAVLHLNLIYVVFVGNDLLRRYDERDDDINDMMAKDQAKDDRIAAARLTAEPKCRHCGKTGLRLTDKMLHHPGGIDGPEEVLFMLQCPSCSKNTACWEDGSVLEPRKTYCPNCKAVMDEKDTVKGKVITTTYTCPACEHSYKDKMDLTVKKKKPDPDFEADRAIYCLHNEKARQELRDAKWRYDEMARLGREWQEKKDNKHIYDAMKELKKPNIPQLPELLKPVIEEAGYIEFSLDKPEMGKDVFIGFSCLDSKSDRGDYDSRKTLKKLVDKALLDTNWRLATDGIDYRLGYLTGRLHAYESEEDLKKLVMKSGKLKEKQQSSKADTKKNPYTIKDKDGNDIIL